MMIRATTTGTLRGYRSNLMSSFTTLNSARDTVLSQRQFNSYAENPASAAKAFRLRRSRMAVESQYNITDSTYRKYQVGWQSLDGVEKVVDTSSVNSLKDAALRVLNDPTGDARETLSKTLSQMSDTIIQNMNQKYGDNFVFAGADGANVPFEIRQVDGKDHVFYRGIDVDVDVPDCVMPEGGTAPDDFIKVSVDATTGEIKLDPAGDSFLKTKGTSTISVDEYNKIITPPAVDTINVNGVLVEKEVNADGSPYDATDPDGGSGGYYELMENGAPSGKYISISDYNDAVKKAANPPKILGDGDATTPTYQIVDKDGNPKAQADNDGTDYYLVIDDAETITEAEYTENKCTLDKLNYLAGEKYFVDIGLGFKENEKGELIESSAFNASLSGLTFLGYGMDEDGDPKNIVSIVKRMSEVTESNGTFNYEEFYRLTGKLEKASAKLKVEYSDMDAESTKLKNNLELLEGNFYTLQEEYADLEDVDMADSITSFAWAQYCYNAALKVGNSILSQSLIDYMS